MEEEKAPRRWQFKGRARWVPFHSLALELGSYLKARRDFASAQPEERFFWAPTKRQYRSAQRLAPYTDCSVKPGCNRFEAALDHGRMTFGTRSPCIDSPYGTDKGLIYMLAFAGFQPTWAMSTYWERRPI
jgi:hypothetical protein